LTHKKRIELENKIKKVLKKHIIIQVKPNEIDEAIEGNNSLNLNWLEANKLIEIINKLNPHKAILDCPSPNIEKFKNYILKSLTNKNIDLTLAHKAERFEIVAAASILAKCAREREVEQLKKKYGDIGPGYPSNETTKEFIKENYNKYPEIFRKSWSTWKNIYAQKKQKKLDEF